MARKTETLPPGVHQKDGKLVRIISRSAADGSTRKQVRQVALTLAEAKLHRLDYYHPQLGWMREGYKLERDRPEEDILADASVSAAMTPSRGASDQEETSGADGDEPGISGENSESEVS